MPGSRVPSSVKLPPFQALLDAHGRDVHRFLVATVGPGAADDCYQETWLAALRAYPRLRNATNLRGWLLTIAHRKTLDHFRAGRRDPVLMQEMSERAVPQDGALAEASILNGHANLWAHVRALPPKQRTAVALRYVFDAAYADIAAAMDTSEEAARRNVFEGLKRLRTEYDEP
jgi:RNA polymerase sigma factor (sigma-70 family)